MAPSKRCSLSCESSKSWIATLAILGAFLCNGMIISIANISDEVVVTPNSSKSLKDIPMTYYGILFGIFKLTVIFGLLTQTKFNSLLPGRRWFPSWWRPGSWQLWAPRLSSALASPSWGISSANPWGLIGKHYSTPTFFTIQLLVTLPSFKISASLEGQFGIPQPLKKCTIALSALSVFSASIAIGTLNNYFFLTLRNKTCGSAQCLLHTQQNKDVKNQSNDERKYLLDSRDLQRKYYENM